MVAVHDQRPLRPTDSLKRMVNNLSTPASVPHGIKTAKPGEYVSFYATDGTAHRWDGDAIAEYDARIAEGKVAIDKAKASLGVAEGDIIEARKRIESVETSMTTEAIASGLNEKKLLIGRDAIFTGTIDVTQLNVTEALSAEVVKSMSSETRNLVVTEEAIINRATVVQNLVTPELVAQKVSSALVTGSVIQTDTQANIGVKIDSNGYKAYDGSGNLAVDLNGEDNLIVGTLRTGYLNKPGVVIPQNYTNVAGMEQLGVWLTRDGRAPGTSEASKWGFTSGLWMDQAGTDSASVLPLNIRGQNGGGTRIWGGLALGNANNDAYISPVGTGSMTIRSRGFAALNVDKAVDISSFDVLNLSGTAGVVIKTNGNLAIRDLAGNAYSSTYSGGGLLNMVLGSASGRVYVQSSSERFKTEVVTMEPDDKWLDVRTVWYRDKESVHVRDMVLAREATGDNTPRSAYESERIADAGRLTAGRIAEEAHEAGLSQVVYEADGVTPLSYDYGRDGIMLIPHVRSHRDRITVLEEEVATLKQLLEGATK